MNGQSVSGNSIKGKNYSLDDILFSDIIKVKNTKISEFPNFFM
jgi:hypothetical protein